MASTVIFAENKEFIVQFCGNKVAHKFNYDLAIKLVKSESDNADYMVCCHGSGANNTIADSLKSYNVIADNLVSFNFPDHDMDRLDDDPTLSTFGTIQELLPALYVIKNLVIGGNLKKINLYGFSAGGGVVINILTVLSGGRYNKELQDVGITEENKAKILGAISNGLIILDCPLKSCEEIIALRGSDPSLNKLLTVYSQRYKDNDLVPIESIKQWKNLNLAILLYFEVPDEKLSNRDDTIFADLVRNHNNGLTELIYGSDGGHCEMHTKLWDSYIKLMSNITSE